MTSHHATLVKLYPHPFTYLTIWLGVPLYNDRPCVRLRLEKLCIYTAVFSSAGSQFGNDSGPRFSFV